MSTPRSSSLPTWFLAIGPACLATPRRQPHSSTACPIIAKSSKPAARAGGPNTARQCHPGFPRWADRHLPRPRRSVAGEGTARRARGPPVEFQAYKGVFDLSCRAFQNADYAVKLGLSAAVKTQDLDYTFAPGSPDCLNSLIMPMRVEQRVSAPRRSQLAGSVACYTIGNPGNVKRN
jgi:hypothetical protein